MADLDDDVRFERAWRAAHEGQRQYDRIGACRRLKLVVEHVNHGIGTQRLDSCAVCIVDEEEADLARQYEMMEAI